MKTALVSALVLSLLLPATAQSNRRSLLDRDPDVVHLEEHVKKPIELKVIKEVPVYSDKSGRNRVGVTTVDQTVVLESMTEKAYRVRGQGQNHGISGWVGPHAFSSKDPDFIENLKKLYTRQIEVQGLIEEKIVAVGMTQEEAGKVLGKPTKSTVKQTETGQTGRWEFVDYGQVQHFNLVRDTVTGQLYRQLSHVTTEEKSKTVIEFENGVVTSVEESKQRRPMVARIIVPPVVSAW